MLCINKKEVEKIYEQKLVNSIFNLMYKKSKKGEKKVIIEYGKICK